MGRSCIECVHNNPNDPSDLAYACLNCSWPTFAGEPTNFKSKLQTNADRIRAMSDEELANFIVHRDCCPGFVADTFSDANRKKYGFDGRSERCEYGDECHECWLDWLRQEANADA